MSEQIAFGRNELSRKSASKMHADDLTLRLAVLIDADNAQASVVEQLLAEIALYGEATVKRIYGDFTSTASSSWKKVLQKYAIKPIQQFAYTTGKNATDSALIIDAMDLLYTRKFDGFCLVTSDSDFTGLAMRIREEGLTVLGFGEKKTPDAFRSACHKFTFTELLRTDNTELQEATYSEVGSSQKVATGSIEKKAPRDEKEFPAKFLLTALEQSIDDTEWASLAVFGSFLNKLQPDFDSRMYGYKNLSNLVRTNTSLFLTEERQKIGTNYKAIYLRAKPKSNTQSD